VTLVSKQLLFSQVYSVSVYGLRAQSQCPLRSRKFSVSLRSPKVKTCSRFSVRASNRKFTPRVLSCCCITSSKCLDFTFTVIHLASTCICYLFTRLRGTKIFLRYFGQARSKQFTHLKLIQFQISEAEKSQKRFKSHISK